MTGSRSGDLRNYTIVTGAYWADTLTDGALRVLVLDDFYDLGYSPFQVASLFLFYEIFGIVTNLVGGFLAARSGLKMTLVGGLTTQLVALSMLAFAPRLCSWVPYVMVAQALSGIAKDLTKMSSKSAVKLVVPSDASAYSSSAGSRSYGIKERDEGIGFFVGGLLLTLIGFQSAILVLIGARRHRAHRRSHDDARLARSRQRQSEVLAHVLELAGGRTFSLLRAWFFSPHATCGSWSDFRSSCARRSTGASGRQAPSWAAGLSSTGSFRPQRRLLLRRRNNGEPTGLTATWLAFVLAASHRRDRDRAAVRCRPSIVVVVGFSIWGVIFALNSAVHSFLILHYAEGNKVAMNVGFYYMANAAGRLIGTVLSGLLYQWHGLTACLVASVFPRRRRHALALCSPAR